MKPRRKAELVEMMTEDSVRQIAKIIGPMSAAQGCLDRAAELREQGQTDIIFFRRGEFLCVGPNPFNAEDEA